MRVLFDCTVVVDTLKPETNVSRAGESVIFPDPRILFSMVSRIRLSFYIFLSEQTRLHATGPD